LAHLIETTCTSIDQPVLHLTSASVMQPRCEIQLLSIWATRPIM